EGPNTARTPKGSRMASTLSLPGQQSTYGEPQIDPLLWGSSFHPPRPGSSLKEQMPDQSCRRSQIARSFSASRIGGKLSSRRFKPQLLQCPRDCCQPCSTRGIE